MHGEWWVEHHLRYIRRLWDTYPTRQKVHFSALYGCHASFWRGGKNSVVCGSNDRPLARFLKRSFREGLFDNTLVVLMGDHGYHYTYAKCDPSDPACDTGQNEFVAGEYEHRHPALSMIVPPTLPTEFVARNADRFVTHQDVHATLMGIARGQREGWWGQNALAKVFGHSTGKDLLREEVSTRRSCHEAGIPHAWCGCFGIARGTDPRVDSRAKGVSLKAPAGLLRRWFGGRL